MPDLHGWLYVLLNPTTGRLVPPQNSWGQFDDQPGSRRDLLLGSFRVGTDRCLKKFSDQKIKLILNQMMADTCATVAGSVHSMEYSPVLVEAVYNSPS